MCIRDSLKDSKSTSGAYLVLIGPRTYVPITWFAKKQGAVSHSSSEAEVISLDASLRTEGIPALLLWDLIREIFLAGGDIRPKKTRQTPKYVTAGTDPLKSILHDVDYVPSNLPPSKGGGQLIILEDNDAVIKMCIKGRSPNMRHVARTHRVDLDFLFERIREDTGIFLRFIGTKLQVADLFTKGSFNAQDWKNLTMLANIGPLRDFGHKKELSLIHI